MSEETGPNDIVESASSEIIDRRTKSNDVTDLIGRISHLESDDIICRPNCKFCNHPKRLEAESLWEEQGTYKSVQDFLNIYASKNPGVSTMTIQNVRNHLRSHYDQQMERVNLREYSDRLGEVMSSRRANEQRCEEIIAILELQLLELASDPEISKAKKALTTVKLTKAIVDTQALQEELRQKMRDAAAVVDRFVRVWRKAIEGQEDNTIKQILIDTLDQFDSEVGMLQTTG